MRKAQLSLAIIALLILTGFTALVIHSGVTAERLNFKTIKLESTETKLKDVNLQVEQLKTQSSKDKEKQEQFKKQLEQKEKEKKELEAKLQAKIEAKAKLALAAEKASNTLTGSTTVSAAPQRAITGNKQSWLAASGIPQSEWGYVDQIVSRESGWNPCAYNPGQSDCNANPSSACGLAQSLPCGKQSKYGHWTDPVANLKWQYEYVKGRYGGYAQAVAFWNANHWY